jgi:hypothetical protein
VFSKSNFPSENYDFSLFFTKKEKNHFFVAQSFFPRFLAVKVLTITMNIREGEDRKSQIYFSTSDEMT